MERILTSVEDWLMSTAFFGALLLGVMQVVLRYVFNTGFVWVETALVALTILAAMTGGSRAAARGVHVRISLVTDMLKGASRRFVNSIALLVTILYCTVLVCGGVLYVQFLYQAGVVSIETGLPAWVFATIAPFTLLLFVLRYLQQLPATLRGQELTNAEFID